MSFVESNRVFVFYKPENVVCSTVDSNLTNIIQHKSHPNYGQQKGGDARQTVYDIARQAGFPTNYGLVGRLDTATSGLMLFTNNSDFLVKVCHPPLSHEEYTLQVSQNIASSSGITSYDDYLTAKSKQYELIILSGKSATNQILHGNYVFNADEFEQQLSQPFTFSRNNITYEINGAKVQFIERYQDLELSHGRAELGKHHQIRRMAHRHDYHVRSLKRISIGNLLSIDSIPQPGDCRWLTKHEYETMCLHLGVVI